MESISRKLPLAIAIGALSVSFGAVAQDPTEDVSNFTKNYTKNDEENHYTNSETNTYVELNKDLQTEKDLDIRGHLKVKGEINADGSGLAVINDKQSSHNNTVTTGEEGQTNDANLQEEALTGAEGRVAVNIVSGDANQQDNATALSSLTAASDLLYSADAEVFSYQDSEFNQAEISDTTNNAHLRNNTLNGASGDIAVNVTAGHNQQQKNNLALSNVTNGSLAEANVSAEQYSDHNEITTNEVDNAADIGATVLGGATGNVAVNVSAGVANQQGNHMALSTATGNPAAVGGGDQ